MYTNLDDVITNVGITQGYIKNGTTQTFFESAKKTSYRTVYANAERLDSIEDGMNRVDNGDFVFFLESPFIQYELSQDCQLQQIGPLLNTRGFGFAFPKGNPLKGPFNEALRERSARLAGC